MEVNYTTADNG